jgi:hypothetical protein
LHFDTIGIPSLEEMTRAYGSPERWQADATRRWLLRIAADRDSSPVTILEGQTRPDFARSAAGGCAQLRLELILLECSASTRAARLQKRGQPELANEQMQSWAAYLRGEADRLGFLIIDTTELSIEQVADALEQAVEFDPVP